MRIRKDEKVARATARAGARATARVAPTILRKRQEKGVYGRGDPCGRPGFPGRSRPGNFVIHYMAGALALALTCFCVLCIIYFTASVHASVGVGYLAAQAPLNKPADTSTPSPTVTDTP